MGERSDVGRERLAAAVESLVTGEDWQAWLESRAKFHRYSLGNTLLIAFQRPDATQVAGYKKWPEFGRHVRKGETGIAILAPMVRKVAESDDVRDDSGRRVFGFRTVYVFDVSQTEGDDLPEPPCRLLEGDSGFAAVSDALIGHLVAEGLELETGNPPMAANGFIDRAGRKIVVSAALERDAALKTLVHELAHWHDLGLEGGCDRADAEIVAEAVAFVVGYEIGLDTSSYSAGYVASWAGGDAAKLHELAERIDKACKPILEAIDRIGARELEPV